MFGLPFDEDHQAFLGWRAIHKPGTRYAVDILPDRGSRQGDNTKWAGMIEWVNETGAWQRMKDWASNQWGSSYQVFEESEGDLVLRATPNASHGYLYIGLAYIPEYQEMCEAREVLGDARRDPDFSKCRARFRIAWEDADLVRIRDIGPWDTRPTVTNDLEAVVEALQPTLAGRELFYFDSQGNLAQIVIEAGKFKDLTSVAV